MSDDELALYQRIYEHLAPQAVVPDLVIYLQAPVETLMARVRRRAAGLRARHQRRLPDAARPQAYGRFFHDVQTLRRC